MKRMKHKINKKSCIHGVSASLNQINRYSFLFFYLPTLWLGLLPSTFPPSLIFYHFSIEKKLIRRKKRETIYTKSQLKTKTSQQQLKTFTEYHNKKSFQSTILSFASSTFGWGCDSCFSLISAARLEASASSLALLFWRFSSSKSKCLWAMIPATALISSYFWM